jgi:exodeoxyribonuclease V alpha subunit
MSEFKYLTDQLIADTELWNGLALGQSERESIISQFLGGAVAVKVTGQTADISANEHFQLAEIGGAIHFIPGRYKDMLAFFLQSLNRPGEQRSAVITPGVNTLVTGGPGTGKSYQISRFVELLAANQTDSPVRVAIAAPTGKAAARFTALEALHNLLLECLTIHRLLQLSPDGSRAKYDAANPLPVDVLIVDEISMVDLGLFARLVAAVPRHAQIVLAGDIGQLPAVDGIAIAPALDFLKEHGLLAHLELTETHRFSAAKAAVYSALQREGIAAVNAQSEGIRIVEIRDNQALHHHVDDYAREIYCTPQLSALAEQLVKIKFHEPAWQQAAKDILQHLQHSIILCESNEGSHGTSALNRRIEAVCAGNKVTPIMVTANSYELQFFNGDTGFIFNDGEQKQVIIESAGKVKRLPLGRLRHWQIAYAITIHKSQGSEYQTVHIVHETRKAAETDHRLLYTAVTRARKQAVILKVR